MDELSVDLLDRRGRARRLVIAAVVGVVVTLTLLGRIRSFSATPNPDAISQATPVLLGIAMFVVTSLLAHAAIEAIRRRRAR